MPGPSSATASTSDVRVVRRPAATVTVIRASAGVWVSALVTRLPTTWRSRASSPSDHRDVGQRLVQAQGDRPVGLRRPGRRARRRRRSRRGRPGAIVSGRCWSSRASSSRSSTSRPIRAPSSSIRSISRRVVLGRADGALPVELGEAADRGQRGAQLVAGVGDEPAHPVLGAAGLLPPTPAGRGRRVSIRASIPLSAVGQPADLGAVVALRHAPGEVAGGDGPRGALDLGQRPQAVAHQHVARRAPSTVSTIEPDDRPRCATSRLIARLVVLAEVGADDDACSRRAAARSATRQRGAAVDATATVVGPPPAGPRRTSASSAGQVVRRRRRAR